MASALPQINVTDPRTAEGQSADAFPGLPSFVEGNGVTKDSRPKVGNATESRSTANGKSFQNKLIRNLSNTHTPTLGQSPPSDAGRDLQTAIDPLSHHILKRSHTQNMIPQKLRAGATSDGDPGTAETGPPSASAANASDPTIARADSSASVTKDKKKSGFFLSRFIGSKKKDTSIDVNDDGSELGDRRTEGVDADVFSQPIGFIPQFPAPPKYIKVRSHGKKEKDFNRIFLAQELRGRTGVEIAQVGGRSVKHGAVKSTGDAGCSIWAMEFSKDGRYLAAGGQDHLVRVWAVISTAENRQAHEKEEDAASKEGERMRLHAPVFKTRTVQEYEGHTASVLDLSWSKNNFLLSSSMDKTVRLWHVSRTECLCCFKHSDFVTSIQFHPRDDRFFLAGSLDSKLRLWSIPDKSVAFWSQLPDLITAVAFAPDGKTAIAGSLNGLCMFYETEGLKFQTQIHVRSTHGRNAKGSKITGIQAINFPPNDPNGEVKLLVTSNDSRVRMYNLRDKGLEMKLKGNQNSCSQIHATFSDDARYVICGSEDRKVHIWSTSPPEIEKDKRPLEMFEAHSAIVTIAIMAPIKTRQLLSISGDPIYDLCNPPPVTLISRTESQTSSKPPTDNEQLPEETAPLAPSAAAEHIRLNKPEETPAYIARSAHSDGNIIVTADYMGRIKVFRQDCAYQKRLRSDTWDTSSTFSKKMLGRSGSAATGKSRSSQRESTFSKNPSSDRILSWRQSVTTNNGSANLNGGPRPASPHKTLGQMSRQSTLNSSRSLNNRPRLHSDSTKTPSISTASRPASPHKSSADFSSHNRVFEPDDPPGVQGNDPLMLSGDQSYLFWNKSAYRSQAAAQTAGHSGDGSSPNRLGVPAERGLSRRLSSVSALSSELSSSNEAEGDAGGKGRQREVRCRRCGGRDFRARLQKGGGTSLECGVCGLGVENAQGRGG